MLQCEVEEDVWKGDQGLDLLRLKVKHGSVVSFTAWNTSAVS